MATTQPIRNKDDLHRLAFHFINKGDRRNHVLINVQLHTALRISDVLNLKTDDVYDYKNRRVRSSIELKEQKTGKTKSIKINNQLAKALDEYFPLTNPGEALILNKRTDKAISRVQAFRIVRDAGKVLKYERLSPHSLRKTFGYHSWKNGVDLATIMEVFNHSNFAVTRRYIGMTQDDLNAAYLQFSA